MQVTNIHEAKTHLSALLARVEAGEEITIGRAGKPIAKIVPYDESNEPRKPGCWKGQVWMSDDFDDPLPEEILAAFRGERD